MESPANSSDNRSSNNDADAVRKERDILLERQRRIAELLNCKPEKIEHDLRNVINELQLLRTIFKQQEQDEASGKQ